MEIYMFDGETKEYIGAEDALLDPLETKKQGKPVYLLPANAVFDRPPIAEGGKAVIFDDGWKQVVDNRGKTAVNADRGIFEIDYLGEKEGDTIVTAEMQKGLDDGTFVVEQGEAVEKPVKKVTVKISPDEEKKDEDGNVLVVARKGEEFEISPNEEEEMVVQLYKDLPVNTYLVESLTDSLAAISATKKVADKAENPADYGLDTPAVTATVVYHDDTEVTVELGNETPLKEGFYFRISGDETVYLVSTSFGNTLLKESLSYIGNILYSKPSVNADDSNGSAILRDMELSGRVRGENKFAFRATTNADTAEYTAYADYIMTFPYARSTNAQTVSDLASAAASLSATKAVLAYPTAEDLAAYGLDDPYSPASPCGR